MLDKKLVHDVLSAAVSTGGDFAEIYVEDRFNTSIQMIGGKIEKSLSGRDFGVGIRIFKDTNSVYTYTNNSEKDNLIKIAKDAGIALNGLPKEMNFDLVKEDSKNIHIVKQYPKNIDKTVKVELMRNGYEAAFNSSKLVNQAVVNYLDNDKKVLIAATDGTWQEDRRTRVRYVVSAMAENDGQVQTGMAGKGAHIGFELFDEYDVEKLGKEAGIMAATMVDAKHAPSGKYPVIMDNAFGGVIFHEACGHGLEATSVAKGASVYCDKIGQKIASDLVTAVDDGTIPNGWGSLNVDDEGSKTQRNVLIENGVLKGYMIDKLNSRRMKMDITGSARRESYKYAPTSRMTNTYILNGESKFDDMIKSVDFGIYAKSLGGGSVNPATGEFNFSVQEGYLIENGKISSPAKGATLIGTGIEVLNKIEMVSDNFAPAEGMCGSQSGSIPAGLGQPALKISEITVGGRDE